MRNIKSITYGRVYLSADYRIERARLRIVGRARRANYTRRAD